MAKRPAPACALLALAVVLGCGDERDAGPAPAATATAIAAATPTPDDAVTLERIGATLRFSTRMGAVRIALDAFRLELDDAGGRALARQVEDGLRIGRGEREGGLGAVRDYELDGHTLVLTVETEVDTARLELTWHTARTLELRLAPPAADTVTHFSDAYYLAPGELIYGLTERPADSRPLNDVPGILPVDEIAPREVGSLDRRGETVEMFVRATFGIYAPFYHSSAGYGLFVLGTTPGVYDVGRTDPDVLRFRFEAGTTPPGRTLRYDLFVGDHAAILDEYTGRTGRPFIPPAWAFRHWRWRGEHAVGAPATVDGVALNAEMAEDLRMYEAFDIPAGVYLLDRPWSVGAFGFDNFVWDPLRWPDAGGMFDVLRARGYRVVVWSAALAAGDAPEDNGSQARARGYLAPNLVSPTTPDAQVIDLTNPDARAWWTAKHLAWLGEWDVDGIKLDRGEEYVPSGATDVYADGRTGREVHNAYPVLNLRLFHDVMRAARGDDFVVTARAAYAGAQQYGVVWGGDTPGSTAFGAGPGTDLGLRSALIKLQRAGFLGFPFWGSDTGGYYQFKQRDVFARWLQFSAFCPLMEIGGVGPHAPWDMPTEPRVDAELIEIYRRYTQLHHDLIPYTMRHAQIAAATGRPIARALVFDFPGDPQVLDRWDQFMFGDDVLVAPVWRDGARARAVYLPAGRWTDFWDRSRAIDGPATVTADAPLDVIPAYVRAGAEVPGRP